MDARRKRMRDEFNDRLNKVNENRNVPTEAEIFRNELSKRSKIIEELRKKSGNLMEQSNHEAATRETQQAKDFVNYRKSAVESATGASCQLKVKWKRSAESHSDDSLYQLFKVFGGIEDAVLVGTKGTSGLVTFTDAVSANKAFEFYRNSEDYRVSLLSDVVSGINSSKSTCTYGVADSLPVQQQQSELSKDIRRAMEKNELINLIGKLRPAVVSDVPSVQVGAENSSVPSAAAASSAIPRTVSAASLASKESEVLQKMMEAARRKKLAQSVVATDENA